VAARRDARPQPSLDGCVSWCSPAAPDGAAVHTTLTRSPRCRGFTARLRIMAFTRSPWRRNITKYVFFFNKVNILISKDNNYTHPLQQRNTLIAVRMHTTIKKRKNIKKQKSQYSILDLATTIYPPPRQHQRYRLSKSDSSKKKTVHQRHRRPTKYFRFFTLKIVTALKTIHQTR
jgi:hypothetical protein